MPLRPPAVVYRCPQCGWKKFSHPQSDALMPGDVIHRCPVCGHFNLETRLAEPLDVFLHSLAAPFSKKQRSMGGD